MIPSSRKPFLVVVKFRRIDVNRSHVHCKKNIERKLIFNYFFDEKDTKC